MLSEGYFMKYCLLGWIHQGGKRFMCLYWLNCIVQVNCFNKKVSVLKTSDLDNILENEQKSVQKVGEASFNFSWQFTIVVSII